MIEKTLEQLQAEFKEIFEKDIPNNKKSDREWITKKIAEAKKIEEKENQTETEVKKSTEGTTETVEENKEQEESTDYDDNTEENLYLTEQAKKIAEKKYSNL